jgi:hypothetical protein
MRIENPDDFMLINDMATIVAIVPDSVKPFEKAVFPINYEVNYWGIKFTTLEIIRKQIRAAGLAGTIMVLYETAMSGTVYRYGNHGDYWEEVGTLKGWA